jgi:hypothetical protein
MKSSLVRTTDYLLTGNTTVRGAPAVIASLVFMGMAPHLAVTGTAAGGARVIRKPQYSISGQNNAAPDTHTYWK